MTFLPDGTTAPLPGTPAGGFTDGVLHFTTVSIPTGVTLRFPSNLASPVTILAQSTVTIEGTIDVSGAGGSPAGTGKGGFGGPGGFKGGNGQTFRNVQLGGTGMGPGGGGGGAGATGLLGGGGGGGGAILIASSTTITVNGTIVANGGAGGSQGGGGGSGGSIRLVATTLAGSGFVNAGGGAAGGNVGAVASGGAGGAGRIRLEAFFFTFPGTNATPGVLSTGSPRQIFVPNTPSVRVVSVGGIAVAANPIGVFGGVDVELPGPGTFPVVIAAARVPVGTTVSVTAKPESDASVIGPITSDGLAGTPDSSQVTVNLTFPSGGVYFIEARDLHAAVAR